MIATKSRLEGRCHKEQKFATTALLYNMEIPKLL